MRIGGRKKCLSAIFFWPLALLAAALSCASPATPTPVPSPQLSPTPLPLSPALEEARNLYISKGCVNCHGPNLEFLVVVNLPEISEKAVMHQARNPTGMMPSFSTEAISDEELGKIARFIVSVLSQRGK